MTQRYKHDFFPSKKYSQTVSGWGGEICLCAYVCGKNRDFESRLSIFAPRIFICTEIRGPVSAAPRPHPRAVLILGDGLPPVPAEVRHLEAGPTSVPLQGPPRHQTFGKGGGTFTDCIFFDNLEKVNHSSLRLCFPPSGKTRVFPCISPDFFDRNQPHIYATKNMLSVVKHPHVTPFSLTAPRPTHARVYPPPKF